MIFSQIASLFELMKHFNMQILLLAYGHLKGLEGIGMTFKGSAPIDSTSESIQSNVVLPLQSIQKSCSELGLSVGARKAEAVRQLVLSNTLTSQGFSSAIRDLDDTIAFEMESHVFMYIEPIRVPLYTQPDLFGPEVASNFPSAEPDINEAGKCLALNRGTACVFHLMRVLQLGLYALADDLSVPNLKVNWQNAIDQIEKAIRGFERTKPPKTASQQDQDSWQELRDFYAQAATHFMYVKNAWRNISTHRVGQIYSEDDAQSIYDNVRGFMRTLASRLTEKP